MSFITRFGISGNGKVFLEFGGWVVNAGVPDGATVHNWIFELPAGSPVYAAIDGVVSRIFYQEDPSDPTWSDYEIHLTPALYFNQYGHPIDQEWLVIYDHVTNLVVSEGQVVQAGEKIAEAVDYIVEFYVQWNEVVQGAGSIASVEHCPTSFFDESVRPEFEAKINTLMSDTETFRGDDTLYDEDTMVEAGCLCLEGGYWP